MTTKIKVRITALWASSKSVFHRDKRKDICLRFRHCAERSVVPKANALQSNPEEEHVNTGLLRQKPLRNNI